MEHLPLISLLIFLLAASVVIPPTAADITFLQTMCDRSSDSDSCVKVLAADPRSLNCVTRKCVAQIMSELIQAQCHRAGGVVALVHDKGPLPKYEDAVNACLQIYSIVTGEVANLVQLVAARRRREAETLARQIWSLPMMHCESAFSNQPSPMRPMNKKFADMVGYLLDILKKDTGSPP